LSGPKILHAADIHLDSPLQKLDRYDSVPADRIRGATRRALENLTQLAVDERVDLVVIAGDLYDGDWNDQDTGLFFVGQAAKLVDAGIPLLVIRGNHDAANQMTRSLPLPQNPDGSDIFLSHQQPETRRFDDLGIAVHGQSFQSRAETRNLAQAYPGPIPGMFNLGMLHTGLEGNTVHGNYAPCTPSDLTDKKFDYWALGHIHQFADHRIDDGPPIVFSGNIQGRHVGELGAKGCVLLDVQGDQSCRYRFAPLDVVRWQRCRIDASRMNQTDQVHDAFVDWLNQALANAEGRLVVGRVELTGHSPLHDTLNSNAERLRGELQSVSVIHGGDQFWLEDVRVRTRPPQSTAPSIDMRGPEESLSAVMRTLRDDPALGDVFQQSLEDLIKKLPPELQRDGGGATIATDDDEWCGDLLEAAAADVRHRLKQDVSDESGPEATP